MPETIPLFPLGATVLFPGVVLPLHIFEERYRALVRDLMGLPEGEPPRIGVVAIRQGWEVGADAVAALHDVGCTAAIRRINPHSDGRFDVVGVGQDRFRLLDIDDTSKPYLTGSVEWLPADPDGVTDEAETSVLARAVAGLFRGYVSDVTGLQGEGREVGDLPDDPTTLSYLVASAALLGLEDRQRLLTESDTLERLRAESRLLRRESTIVRSLRAVPVPLTELAIARSVN